MVRPGQPSAQLITTHQSQENVCVLGTNSHSHPTTIEKNNWISKGLLGRYRVEQWKELVFLKEQQIRLSSSSWTGGFGRDLRWRCWVSFIKFWLVSLVKMVNLASLYRLRGFFVGTLTTWSLVILSIIYWLLNIKLDFWVLSTSMYSWLSCSSIEADLSDTKFYLKIWMEMHIKNNTYLSWYIT